MAERGSKLDKIDGTIVSYDGYLDPKKMSKEAAQGYRSWMNQCSRCYRKKDQRSKHYLGLDVNYSSRDFIGWWIHNLNKKVWKDPTVGRIDHSKGYSFDNIEMQERSDNSKERILRTGPFIVEKSVSLINIRTGIVLEKFKNILHAAERLNISYSTAFRRLKDRKGLLKNRPMDIVLVYS